MSTTDTELIDVAVVGARLAEATGEEAWRDFSASLIAGGKSNLPFDLRSAAGEMILRRPPTGKLLPSAHDMAREAKIQRALADSTVPVAPIVLLDESGDDIGVPYYVMEKVDGLVIRDALPEGYAESGEQKTAMADALASTLAEIHSVDPDAVGLGELGKRSGYLERQLRRWLGQSEKSAEQFADPNMRTLHDSLAASMPAEQAVRITHGDFRMDNSIFAREDPGTIRAVLDWELSTLGDPSADLALSLLYWGDPQWPEIPLVPGITRGAGWPGADHFAQRYAERTGTEIDHLDWYLAFSVFKFAAIAQGVGTRAAAGDMAGQAFGDFAEQLHELVDLGRSFL